MKRLIRREPFWQMLFCLFSVLTVAASLWVWYRSRPADQLLNGILSRTVISVPHAAEPIAQDDVPLSLFRFAADGVSLSQSYYDDCAVTLPAPAGSCTVISRDLSGQPMDGQLLIRNQTSYHIDTDELLTHPVSAGQADADPSQPLVLILHTHGTEAYRPAVGLWYSAQESAFRSSDIGENVVAVGEVMQKVLEERGIPTLHCTVMHDAESYNDSYTLSAATIRQYLKEYPSIRYVLDVHRDAITDGDSAVIRCVTQADGQPTAQVMFVVGTDEMGASHPYWRENLALALQLQSLLNTRYGNLARPISLRGAAYNQRYTSGSLLIEVGSTGNTPEEAKRAAALTADALADIITKE